MGAGAIGSYLGAFLSREGYEPTLIDPWPEHVEAMKANGLTVLGSQGPFTVPVKALHLTEVQNVAEPFDIAFIAMKSYDTEWATMFIKRYLAPSGFVVCSQNGINDETVARIAGYERTVGLIMSAIAVGLEGPARVYRGGAVGRDRGHDVFRVGEFNGMVTPRATMLAKMLECIDGSHVTTNLWGERWSKLATNCMGNTLAAMSGLASGDLARTAPRFGVLRDQVVKELVQVGHALGVSIEPIGRKPAEAWLDAEMTDAPPSGAGSNSPSTERPAGANWATSTLQDVIKGRKTEVDYLNGYVSQRGREVGIATPVNDAIVTILKQVDAGLRPASPANVDAVWDLVHTQAQERSIAAV
jgi:2-dehydropantoate 2-reductase